MLAGNHVASIATISFDALWLAWLMVRRNFGELSRHLDLRAGRIPVDRPIHGLFQAVVAPEQFVVLGDECRRAEYTE